jgi:hypothetical protein
MVRGLVMIAGLVGSFRRNGMEETETDIAEDLFVVARRGA